MHLKRYTFASVLLMILVGWFVYAFVSHESVALDIMGIHFPPLPVALWVIIPLLILFIASVLHMSYHALIDGFKLRRYKNDFEKLCAMLSDVYVGKQPQHFDFKTERYALLGKVLEQSRVFPSGNKLEPVGHDKLDRAFAVLEQVKNGEVAELGKLHLENDNPIFEQNQVNRFDRGDVSPEGVLSKPERYPESLRRRAFKALIADAPQHIIEQYKQYFDKETLFVLLGRINADEHRLEIANAPLIDLMEQVQLDEDDYVRASVVLAEHMIPDQRIKLFEMLSEKHEAATRAYLYTLFDLEMVDLANEILNMTQPGEFEKLKAYRELKECGKNFNLKLFI